MGRWEELQHLKVRVLGVSDQDCLESRLSLLGSMWKDYPCSVTGLRELS